jgi:hypothetical protein
VPATSMAELDPELSCWSAPRYSLLTLWEVLALMACTLTTEPHSVGGEND